MAWTLDSDRPIYIQLVERIQLQIVSGHYQPGQKLPSVRDLAAEASVNPNTMQKAFTELESSGLVITQSTSGRTVTDDANLIQNVRREMAGKLAALCCIWDFTVPRHGVPKSFIRRYFLA